MEAVGLDLKMRCNKFGREMHLSELLVYAEGFLIRALVPVLVPMIPEFIGIIKNWMLLARRGFIDVALVAGELRNLKIYVDCKLAFYT